jgi:pimeloyl-ACP methyl ester carboxylesterase
MQPKQQIRFIQWLFPKVEAYFPWVSHIWSRRLFLRPFRFSVPPKEKIASDKAEHLTFKLNNKDLHVYSWGKGPYILFVHGWSGRGTNLFAFIEAIQSSGYRLIAFDAPAHGMSEGEETHALQFLEAIRVIASEIGEPTGYVGHSLGGMGVYIWIESHSLRAPCVLIGSPSEETDIFGTFFRRLRGKGKTIPQLRQWIKKTTGFDFDKELPLYRRPLKNPNQLLLVHDEDDRDCSVEDSRKLHAANPGSQLMITKGLGHLNILKDSKVVLACVEFIKHRSPFP